MLGHEFIYVVVVAVLDAGADASAPRGPQAVADPALPEGRHASGRAGGGIACVEGVGEIEVLNLDGVAASGYPREKVLVLTDGGEGSVVLVPAKHVRYAGGVHKLSCKGSGYVLGEPKTKLSPRTVRLTQRALEATGCGRHRKS